MPFCKVDFCEVDVSLGPIDCCKVSYVFAYV